MKLTLQLPLLLGCSTAVLSAPTSVSNASQDLIPSRLDQAKGTLRALRMKPLSCPSTFKQTATRLVDGTLCEIRPNEPDRFVRHQQYKTVKRDDIDQVQFEGLHLGSTISIQCGSPKGPTALSYEDARLITIKAENFRWASTGRKFDPDYVSLISPGRVIVCRNPEEGQAGSSTSGNEDSDSGTHNRLYTGSLLLLGTAALSALAFLIKRGVANDRCSDMRAVKPLGLFHGSDNKLSHHDLPSNESGVVVEMKTLLLQ